ncbi:MAG: hypothetical protein OXF23_06215, partial [Candidatus Dadabacteria bacterium]|nr:hypothetical protein [Candidatus Dadabacteria bacterium]
MLVFMGGGVIWAADAHAVCTITGPDSEGVRTNTCTGTNTGRQQARGSNTEEKLILESGASITNNAGNGILGRGDGAATNVTVETAGDITASGIGINFDMGRPPGATGHATLRITDGTINAGQTGVNINSRKVGGIRFQMTSGSIGTSDNRVGQTGLSAGIQGTTSTNDIDIDSDSTIYATERGMSLTHAGTGKIDVDLTSNSIIDTVGMGNRGAGLYIARNGSGNINVDNAGMIKSAGFDGIFVLNEADGAIMINHRSGGSIQSLNNGIYVRQGSANAGGNGAVKVESGGDITTMGETGIFLDLNRGVMTAEDQITVKLLTGGTINAGSTGVFVNSRTQGGLVFSIANGASIGGAEDDAAVGQTGASLSLTNTSNSNALDVNSDGAIYARWRGLSLSRAGSGAIELDLTQNSRIETQESLITVGGQTLTRGAGVHAFHRGTGNIEINHSGTINSGKGTGIYAQHDGTGDLSIVNSGTITSGFNGIDARRFDTGRLSITHSGSITSSSGPGIYARHDGARSDNDNNIQDVVINIKGDVTTTDPVQAAVRAETRGAAGNARIWIEHSAGTVKGYWGIFAGPMRFSGSTYEDGGGPLPNSFPSHNGYSHPFRTAVLIRVGGTARIVARNLPGSNNEFTEAQTMHQVGWVSRGLVGNYVGASGITVGGGDYQRIGQEIAAGDKLQTGVTPELRSQFRAIYSAAQAYGTQGRSLGNLLDPRILVGGFTGDPAVDADIDSYFNTGSNLERFREFTLTAQEKAVLEAAFGSGDLNMALNALPPSYTEDYKNTVRWYAGAYNNADFRVNVLRNGEINSDGDGIRLIRRFTSDNNGHSFVFIEEGAKVMAGRYGVRMSGAGISDSVHIPDDPNSPIPEGSIISLRNQVVEVYGELESTGPDGAAIALRGGGHVFVGADTILRSASGTTIKIDEADPGTNLIIQIKMKEGENIAGTFSRAVPGRIVNSSTTRAWVEDENGNFSLVPARTQPRPITPPILPTDSTDPTDPTDPDPTDSTDPTDP